MMLNINCMKGWPNWKPMNSLQQSFQKTVSEYGSFWQKVRFYETAPSRTSTRNLFRRKLWKIDWRSRWGGWRTYSWPKNSSSSSSGRMKPQLGRARSRRIPRQVLSSARMRWSTRQLWIWFRRNLLNIPKTWTGAATWLRNPSGFSRMELFSSP